MTTKQTGLDFLGQTPEELITAGRADSIQSAKRLIEISRLENINYELLEALRQITEDAEDNRMTQASINKAKKAISKAEATQ